ncbi:hypothetical protein BX666DRAFT_1960704 [Dichotomocladium elegans]|nr:hypothetical protein BX666DRAFT_1960704 [Dichotomocladium elegans]
MPQNSYKNGETSTTSIVEHLRINDTECFLPITQHDQKPEKSSGHSRSSHRSVVPGSSTRTKSGLQHTTNTTAHRRYSVNTPRQNRPERSLVQRHSTDLDPSRAVGRRQKYVLVTGGAGYIGSHTVIELLTAGYAIVVMDNLRNSHLEALRRVERLAGRPVEFFKGDVTSVPDLEQVFSMYDFWAVIHFAAIKAVGESTRIPLEYYYNNVTGSIHLLRVMNQFGIKNLVFSSSATVYGEPNVVPVGENAQVGAVTNPYGRTKLFVEEMLRDLCNSDPSWNVCLLRYFNPVGAHPSGMIGEHPQGIPNNLLPYVIRVLQGSLPYVYIYGNDYDTIDGTGVRDYIHVCDLATGHVAALKKLEQNPGCVAYNLGTGLGCSVLEIVHAMEKATLRKIPYKIVGRRPGDVAVCTADATLANRELGWYPTRTMEDMCEDMWRWTRRNPQGYEGQSIDEEENDSDNTA